MMKRNVALSGIGHFVIDSSAGFFPIYIAMKDLDILKAATISTVANLIGNFLQPLFGILSDKFRKDVILIVALIFGPLSMSLIGVTESYALLTFFLVFGKIMISLYHPAGVAVATQSEKGGRSHLRFSIFITIGTIGFAFTGILFQKFVTIFGSQNSYFLSLPGILLALIFLIKGPEIDKTKKHKVLKGFYSVFKENRRFIIILYLLSVIRGAFQIGIIFAVPTLFKGWGFSESLWAAPHFCFIIFGALAMLSFGFLEKKIKPITLINTSMILVVPFFMLFLYFGSIGSKLSLIFISIVGFINFASFPANIVLGQKKMPEFASTISGFLMGAAWGVASIAPIIISAISKSSPLFENRGELFLGMIVIGLVPLSGTILCKMLAKDID